MIDRVHERARNSAERYHASQITKLALTGPGDWERVYRVLEDGDIRGYQDPDRLKIHVRWKGTLEDSQVEVLQAADNMEVEGDLDLHTQLHTRRDGTGET